MNALFSPAVALLNRMRYPKKFALLGVIALLVIGSLLVQLAMTLREDIDFAEKEVDALGIAPRLLQVIQTSQQHRGLSSGLLNGNEEMRPLLQKKTGEVAAAIKSVGDGFVGGAVPSALRRWQEVQKDWAALESGGHRQSGATRLPRQARHGVQCRRLAGYRRSAGAHPEGRLRDGAEGLF